MIYLVTARFKIGTKTQFLNALTQDKIINQKPDGKEICASMKRATINDDGLVSWSCKCFCTPPLQHERQTVYDHYFTDLTTLAIDDYQQTSGTSFMTYLQSDA